MSAEGTGGAARTRQANGTIRAENIDFKTSAKEQIAVDSVVPKRRQELLKWNGWGYKDSKFVVKDNEVYFTGNRYPGIGNQYLPSFTKWVQAILGVDISDYQRPRDLPKPEDYPRPNITPDIIAAIETLGISYSLEGEDRLVRAHGHTLHDVYTLRFSRFKRIPDVVLWPRGHDDVVKVVEFADRNNLVIIPFGGGTAVSGAVECPEDERTIVSLDTSQMNRILWVDRENLVACCESGIVGQDLERELEKLGYTTGHEPDSYEFSTLGGWVSTRASGMKKNVYGNIEDLVVHARMATPVGVLAKGCRVPRISCGPDFDHVIIGSEGSLGVVTEVAIKIRPLPQVRKYGSVVFPDFDSGIRCMREVAKRRCQPASIRLMDNDQFKFGQSLKPGGSRVAGVVEGFKKFYLFYVRGMNVDSIAVMTLLFEGDAAGVQRNEEAVYAIAVKNGGLPAGEENGRRGYMLTFVIAYIRDLGLEYNVVAESFETSVPWDKASTLCSNVKHVIRAECRKRLITHYLVCCRVTQTYDAGCVVYFYFAFNHRDLADAGANPVEAYGEIEAAARDEIVACGGSVSHHHGIGKLRRKWYKETVSDVGVALFRCVKRELDPRNVFATGNLVKCKL